MPRFGVASDWWNELYFLWCDKASLGLRWQRVWELIKENPEEKIFAVSSHCGVLIAEDSDEDRVYHPFGIEVDHLSTWEDESAMEEAWAQEKAWAKFRKSVDAVRRIRS